MAFTFAGLPCFDPKAAAAACANGKLPTDWFGLPNSYLCPLGMAPGRGHLLMARRDIDAIRLNDAKELRITDPGGYAPPLKLPQILATKITCVTPGAEADPASLYHVEIADRRWLFNRTYTVGRSYNVRGVISDSGYNAETLNNGSPWTWTGMIGDLWSRTFAAADAYPGLPAGFSPHGTPENFCLAEWPTAKAIDHVLARLACAVKYDPILGTFSIVRLGRGSGPTTSTTTSSTTTTPRPDPGSILLGKLVGRRIWDDYPVTSDTMLFPEYVRVVFLALPRLSDGSAACYSIDVRLPLAADRGAAAGTTVVLRDDLAATLDIAGEVTNHAALAARAQERADHFWRKRQHFDRPASRVYSGIIDLTPALGENFGLIAWEERGDGAKTSIAADPAPLLEEWQRSCECCPCVTVASNSSTSTTAPPGCASGTCTWTWNNTTKEWTTASTCVTAGCSCLYPDFCGNLACQSTTTYCSQNTNSPPSCSDSTTTPPPPTTTTTPRPTPCTGVCSWTYVGSSWIMSFSNCCCGGSTCYCTGKPTGSGTECEVRAGTCGTTTTTAACIPYSTSCQMQCVPGSGWTNNVSVCPTGCCCIIPQDYCCYSWQVVYSWCSPTNLNACLSQPSPLCNVTTTTTTTTTTTAAPCSGNCNYTCNGGGTQYDPTGNTCTGSCGACPAFVAGPCVPGAPTSVPCA